MYFKATETNTRLAVALVVTTVSLLNSSNPTHAQDIIRKAPAGHSFYVWTDDLSRVVQDGLLLQINNDDWIQTRIDQFVAKYAQTGETSDQHRISKEIRQCLDQLIAGPAQGDGLFMGDVDKNGVKNWTAMSSTTWEHDAVAEYLEEGAQQVESILQTLNHEGDQEFRIRVSFRELDDVAPIEDGELLLGYWTIADSMLIWSPDQETLAIDVDRITNITERLASNRDFQRCQQNCPTTEQSLISFYIAHKDLIWILGNTSPSFLGHTILHGQFQRQLVTLKLWEPVWRLSGLDEIRGVIGHVEKHDHVDSFEADSVLLLKSFLLTTAPRQRLLKTVSNSKRLNFDVPITKFPLERFIEFQFDGRELAEAMHEPFRTTLESSAPELNAWLPGAFPVNWGRFESLDSESQSLLIDHTRGVFHASHPLRFHDKGSYDVVGIHVDSENQSVPRAIEQHVESNVRSYGVNGDSVLDSSSSYDTRHVWSVESKAADRSIQENRKKWTRQLEHWTNGAIQSFIERHNREPNDEELERIQATFEEWEQGSLSLYTSVIEDHAWLKQGPWFLNQPVPKSSLGHMIEPGDIHPDLLRLEQHLEAVRELVRCPPPFGISAHWYRSQSTGTSSEDVEKAKRQTVAPLASRIGRLTLDALYRQAEAAVMLSCDNEGFYMTGWLVVEPNE